MGDTEKTILEATQALKSLGHRIVPFTPPDSFKATDIFGDLLTADGGKFFTEMLMDDEISPSFQTFKYILSVPAWKRRLLSLLPLPGI